jgi:signal peptidase I
MNFNFELILFYASIVSGLICLIDWLFFMPRRKRNEQGEEEYVPILTDYARSFFPVLVIVFLLRSFLFEPFRIPSGSLEPTLLKGDFILVNKFSYGTRLPILHTKLFGDSKPERGDIIVFRWPPDQSYDFIKRVIGLPGDHIRYINKELFINGQKIPQTFLKKTVAEDEIGGEWTATENKENLLGVKHDIYVDPEKPKRDFEDIVVPEGMYFVMGDNRDDSMDSRYWGFVPDENIVGKAIRIWLSWNRKDMDSSKMNSGIRWDRVGKRIE